MKKRTILVSELALAIEKAGMPLTEISSISGVSQSQLSRYKSTGLSEKAPYKAVVGIAKALGTSPEKILEKSK